MSDFVAPNGPVSVAEAWTKRTRRVTATYLALTKPRVIELLLVTTVPAMVLAARGLPSLALIAAVLVGGAFAAGGANTINCWIERDRDQLMRRTRHRPLPTGAVDPARALVFGLILEVAAFAILWASANLLAASLAIAATVFYVFVYTIWLKPRTVQNIVIGGAAGAVPVLVGWAAVTGSLALPALILFAVVFCWTPAHFWALALRYREDYAAAGFPMLPVVRGPAVAASQILTYTVIVSLLTLTLPLVTTMGIVYWGAAGLLGVLLTVQAFRLRRSPSEQRAIAFFGFSNTYLALLFAAVALDILLRAH
ncbi:MAG TPA: heme o synthase [Acidimicrobiia bacterium]|nr:heme o synthase [Acidimicrobiia bacterium]